MSDNETDRKPVAGSAPPLSKAKKQTNRRRFLRTTLLTGGVLGAAFYFLVKLTLYFAGAILGLVVGLLIAGVFNWQDQTLGWILALAGLGLGGFFGPRLGDLVLVLAAASLGAYAAVMGMTMLLLPGTETTGTIQQSAPAFIVFITLLAVSTLSQMQIRDLRRRLIR